MGEVQITLADGTQLQGAPSSSSSGAAASGGGEWNFLADGQVLEMTITSNGRVDILVIFVDFCHLIAY